MAAKNKQIILDCAQKLFYENGYLATSVDRILQDAGVTKSNFYYHFKSKEELGLTVLHTRWEQLGATLHSTLSDTSRDPAERLRAFLGVIADCPRPRPMGGCPFGNLVVEVSEQNERFREELQQIFCSIAAGIERTVLEGQQQGVFRSDFSAHAIAALAVQTVQGAQLMLKCRRTDDWYELGFNTLLQLIAQPGTAAVTTYRTHSQQSAAAARI